MVRTINPDVEKMYKNDNRIEIFSQISLLVDNIIKEIAQEGTGL
jgi:trk system potassium uptake protein TrkA